MDGKTIVSITREARERDTRDDNYSGTECPDDEEMMDLQAVVVNRSIGRKDTEETHNERVPNQH